MSERAPLRLPGILAEIAEIAGPEAALRVAMARGGTRAYFSERPRPGSWLFDAVGESAAAEIGAHFASGHGGIELEVPLGPTASRAQVWGEIRRRLAEGQSKRQIARALRVSERTVQFHKNGHRVLGDEQADQLSLFE